MYSVPTTVKATLSMHFFPPGVMYLTMQFDSEEKCTTAFFPSWCGVNNIHLGIIDSCADLDSFHNNSAWRTTKHFDAPVTFCTWNSCTMVGAAWRCTEFQFCRKNFPRFAYLHALRPRQKNLTLFNERCWYR